MSEAASENLAAHYLRRVPKVELHVHLEGAIRPPRLLRILRRHGLHPELRHEEDLAWLYQHADFAEFLDHFRFVVTSLRDVQDVHEVARDLFVELEQQNVVYAEVLFSAAIFVRNGMPWDELLAAVSEARPANMLPIDKAAPSPLAPDAPTDADPEQRPRNRFNLVIDLVRNFGPEFARQQVEELLRLAHPAVVGIHLGGDEAGFPARLFADAYHMARAAGLGVAAHAGEGAGAHSVREALDILGVTRVGHGIRSFEDPSLISELVQRQVTLEVCPTSNLQTQVVPDLASHPLPRLLQAGVPVTLSSDDPSYFDTDVTRELVLAHEGLGVDLEKIDATVEQGIRAAFIPLEERSARLQALQRERQVLRREIGLPG